MLQSYLKTAFRFLWRQKAYSAINVVGLTVGLACSFFILLWVQDELRVDRFHEDGDRLYRVMRNAHYSETQLFTWPAIPMPLAAVLEENYPEITDAVLASWDQQELLSRGEEVFRESGRYAGPAFFDIFSYPLLVGDPAQVLREPTSIALSEPLARKLFGPSWREGIVGQTVRVNNDRDLTVTGVFAEVPRASSVQFDFVISVEDFIQRNSWVQSWGNNGLRLFVRLDEGAEAAAVTKKIRNVVNDNNEAARSDIFLQPYEDMYLYNTFAEGRLVGGRIDYVRVFGVVAVFILVIAGINFMNLATARSAKRSREIGVRKVVGASRGSLVRQFLGESVVIALLAFVLAVGLVALGLPAFNELTGKETGIFVLGGGMLGAFLVLALVTGLLAGSYPALYLASFNVIGVMRGGGGRRGGGGLRKGLVVFQFALSIVLIIGTVTVYRQIGFIHDKNLGLERENVVALPLEGAIGEQFEPFKQELLAQPGIASVTRLNANPLSMSNSTTSPAWEGKDPDSQVLFYILNVDVDFEKALGMDLVAGRTFSEDFASDSAGFIVNQRAAEVMGMENPVGQPLSMWGVDGHILGVVRDFHMTSFYEPIEPTILRLDPANTFEVYVRTAPGETAAALASLKAIQHKFNAAYPFEYSFLDQSYEDMYRSEAVIGTLANYFAVLGVFIACLGLFGLASFTAEQRTREIGIRKVMGASVAGLVVLMSRDFIKLVVAAFVLAAPVAYLLMQRWLEDFTYHTTIGPAVYVTAGLAAVAIAWLTVGYQAVTTARANPVKALRTD